MVVDARLISGEAGGVEGVIAGLAHGLSGLDGPDEFVFVTWEGESGWLEEAVVRPVRIVAQQRPPSRGPAPSLPRRAGRVKRTLRALAAACRPSTSEVRRGGSHPQLDGFIESLQPDVVHQPIQRGFLTEAPSIYHPHDLQHVHLPQFFSRAQIGWRERWYGDLCRRASLVAVASEWTRRDVMDHFALAEGKVRVVPLAPPLAATRQPTRADQAEIQARLGLPERYVLYPAQTWPHKNHLRLLEALSRVRAEHGLAVPLVATGRQTDHLQVLVEAAAALGVADLVTWTGFLPAIELQAVYRGATAVVVPTLFEAASGPLWEAFAAGVPAACSNVTSLPEQAGDAAIVFDPLDSAAIARAIVALWRDDDLRKALAARGRERVGLLSWERTARIFRAHYRRLSGATLSEEDDELIA